MTDIHNIVPEQVLLFGPYQLFRSQKLLLERGKPVRLGSRALEILIALVERAGEVVTKNELMSYAWPRVCVEESNLRVHVAALRKILGDGDNGIRYIINVVGRGYSFVAPVKRGETAPPTLAVRSALRFNLPAPSTRVLGRSDFIEAVSRHLRHRRLVTLVGPAGVGKTTVALALGEQLLEAFGQRVCFVDLATLEDPNAVPAALATLIGISALADDPLASIVLALQGSRMLIILDNCEHVIAEVAILVESLLRNAPEVTVLATSREPLCVLSEYVCNLEPLAHPPEDEGLSIEAALRFPAIQLFVERATAGLESFALTELNLTAVTSICRRVDGIPLAIELIAARSNLFGVETLAADFTDNLLLVVTGRRTAQARQQSLRATLDWSYRTLLPAEQLVLRRLSIFRAAFSAQSATAIATHATIDAPRALEALMSLVSKSLVMTDISDRSIRYRLLHVTRVYAAEKLTELSEHQCVARAHAVHIRDVLELAQQDWESLTRADWLARYGRMIDDVRAALDWAFCAKGDLELGTALTVASLPFGFQLSLIDEFKRRAQRALEGIATGSPQSSLHAIRITNSLVGLLHATGAPDEALLNTITRAVKFAEAHGDPRQLIEPYTTRAFLHVEAGDYRAAVKAAEALHEAARKTDDGLAQLMADRVGAQIHFNAGDFARARQLAERVLHHPAPALPLIYGQVPINRQVSMRSTLARVLWLEGRADSAEALIVEAIALADSDGPTTLCQALGLAGIPIALWRGDLDAAARRTEDLLEHSRRHNFHRWYRLGLCYQKSLHPHYTLPGHDSASQAIPGSTLLRDLLCTVSTHWLDASTLRRARALQSGWCSAELLRLAGESEQMQTDDGSVERAAAHFKAAITVAQAQGSLSWELRAVMSVARVCKQQGRAAEGLSCLRSICDRFSEGHATADLIKARQMIDELDSLTRQSSIARG